MVVNEWIRGKKVHVSLGARDLEGVLKSNGIRAAEIAQGVHAYDINRDYETACKVPVAYPRPETQSYYV